MVTTLINITLDGDGKSFIIDNTVRKEAILIIQPLYLRDSDETDVLDFGGTIKTITLTGIYDDGSRAALKTFIESVEALIQGQQDPKSDPPYPLDFADELRGNIKVKLMDFESSQTAGEVTKGIWTLKLVQSSERA